MTVTATPNMLPKEPASLSPVNPSAGLGTGLPRPAA
jgi:hypothetical protein